MTKCNRYYSVSILWLSQQCRDLWPSKTLPQFHQHYIQFLFSFYLLSFPCLPHFLFLNPKCWQGPALCSLPFYLSPSETASTCMTLTNVTESQITSLSPVQILCTWNYFLVTSSCICTITWKSSTINTFPWKIFSIPDFPTFPIKV